MSGIHADLHVDLLIVTPPASSIIHRKLDEIALTTPIVCLSETAEIPFIFYVGANFYQDGVLLGGRALKFYKSMLIYYT